MARKLFLLVLMLLAGCTFPAEFDSLLAGNATQTPIIGVVKTELPTPGVTSEPLPTEVWDAIEIWLPPQFDPSGSSPAAQILRNRLNAYELQSGYRVRVRIKSEAGPSGLMDAVAITKASAPMNLPSLVLFTREDMETAALKGYLVSLDGKSLLIDDPDWYPYAQEMAFIQGSQFGLPIAGDTQMTVYRRAQVGLVPAEWDAISAGNNKVVFPAADINAYVTIAGYLAAGGVLQDSQGRPQVDPEPLLRVLDTYDQVAQGGLFHANIAQFQTDAAAWQVYQEQGADIAITWASRYLSQLPADSVAAPVPGVDGTTISLGTAWMLTLTDPLLSRQAAAVELAEFLCDPDFQSEWTAAVGYLPTRPSALDQWSDQSLRTTMSGIITTSQAMPSNDVISSLGPVLQDVALQVIRQQSDPQTAVDDAVERLLPPEVE